jgi:broad specificity phosphatase PhoE
MQSHTALILRHLDDIQDFRIQDRNTGILESEQEKIPAIVENIIQQFHTLSKANIQFICSNRLRAIHTVEAVMVELNKRLVNVPVVSTTDERIRDLYHGEYTIPKSYRPGSKLLSVAVANEAYIDQTFVRKNLDYHNGDPLGITYPQLNGLFSHYGETQREFSIRFYDFVQEFLEKVHHDKNTLYIVVTHTAIVFRFFELTTLYTKDQGFLNNIQPGNLTFFEWDCAKDLPHTPEKLFVSPGELKTVNLLTLLNHRKALQHEIAILRSVATPSIQF